jgi:hypothetical protein
MFTLGCVAAIFVYIPVNVINPVTWICLPGRVTLFTSNVIGRGGHVTLTLRFEIGRGRGHVTDVAQCDWAAIPPCFLLVCIDNV